MSRTFGALRDVLRSRYAKLHTKSRVYLGAALPLLFCCESWLVDVAALHTLVVFHKSPGGLTVVGPEAS